MGWDGGGHEAGTRGVGGAHARSYASLGSQESSPKHAKRAPGAESRKEERGTIISSAWCRDPPLRATAEVTSWRTQAKGAGRVSGRELAARFRRALSQRRHACAHAPLHEGTWRSGRAERTVGRLSNYPDWDPIIHDRHGSVLVEPVQVLHICGARGRCQEKGTVLHETSAR